MLCSIGVCASFPSNKFNHYVISCFGSEKVRIVSLLLLFLLAYLFLPRQSQFSVQFPMTRVYRDELHINSSTQPFILSVEWSINCAMHTHRAHLIAPFCTLLACLPARSLHSNHEFNSIICVRFSLGLPSMRINLHAINVKTVEGATSGSIQNNIYWHDAPNIFFFSVAYTFTFVG